LRLKLFNVGRLDTCSTLVPLVEMVAAIRAVLKGGSYLSPALKEEVDQLRWQQKTMIEESDRLTGRQREVLQLLAEGKSMKEVGAILYTTTRTVAFHKYQIMEVVRAKTSADLVRYAVRNLIVAA
jgi:DNA-binding NarL/FixJ family response regulator